MSSMASLLLLICNFYISLATIQCEPNCSPTITSTVCNFVHDDSGTDTARSPGYCNVRKAYSSRNDWYFINSDVFEGWQYNCDATGEVTVLYKSSNVPFTSCDDGTQYDVTTWLNLIPGNDYIQYQCGMNDCTVMQTVYKTNTCGNNIDNAHIEERSAFVIANDLCYEADPDEYIEMKCSDGTPAYIAYNNSQCSGSPDFVGARADGLCQESDGQYLTYTYTKLGNDVTGAADCLIDTQTTTDTPTTTDAPTTTNTHTTGKATTELIVSSEVKNQSFQLNPFNIMAVILVVAFYVF